MRMMVVGMGERSSTRLQEMTKGMTTPHRIVPDWTQMEAAVAAEAPDIVALYLDQSPAPRLAATQRLRALYPAVEVIALCDESDPALIKQMSLAGCADLVVLADCPQDIRRALKALQERPTQTPTEGTALALLGGKGGVGTTTVACNLADALARTADRSVILVDLNLYMGDVAVTLDLKPDPTALFFLQRVAHADAQVLVDQPQKHPRGFRVMGLDGDMESADPVSAEQVVFLIERLRQRYDFVVLDCGTNLTEVSMTACSTADRRLIVLTEQLAARLGARRRLLALRALDPERRNIHALLNRCQESDPEHLQRVEQSIGMPILATLANAWQEVSQSLERGVPLLEQAPRSPITADFMRLAEALGGDEHDNNKRKKAFFDFFR